MAPRTRTLKEILGVDVPGDDSQISVPTGDSIFSRLSDDDKRVVLGGPGALAAWRAGEVELRDFIGLRRSPVWGDSHFQRSLRDARAAADERRRRAPPTPPPSPRPDKPKRPRKSASAEQGPPPSRARPNTSKVSGALKLDTYLLENQGASVLAAIDRVHGDGPLPELPVRVGAPGGRRVQAAYRRRRTNEPFDIVTRKRPPQPRLTLAHEIGHFIDNAGMTRTNPSDPHLGKYASQAPDFPGMDSLMGALRSSASVKTLLGYRDLMRQQGYVRLEDGPNSSRRLILDTGWLDYAVSEKELWARAYAQYIAVRSGDKKMMAELRRWQKEYHAEAGKGDNIPVPEQWDDDDFSPIAAAIDRIFEALGWLH